MPGLLLLLLETGTVEVASILDVVVLGVTVAMIVLVLCVETDVKGTLRRGSVAVRLYARTSDASACLSNVALYDAVHPLSQHVPCFKPTKSHKKSVSQKLKGDKRRIGSRMKVFEKRKTYEISEIEIMIRLIITTSTSRIFIIPQADIIVLSIHICSTHCIFTYRIISPYVYSGIYERIG